MWVTALHIRRHWDFVCAYWDKRGRWRRISLFLIFIYYLCFFAAMMTQNEPFFFFSVPFHGRRILSFKKNFITDGQLVYLDRVLQKAVSSSMGWSHLVQELGLRFTVDKALRYVKSSKQLSKHLLEGLLLSRAQEYRCENQSCLSGALWQWRKFTNILVDDYTFHHLAPTHTSGNSTPSSLWGKPLLHSLCAFIGTRSAPGSRAEIQTQEWP